MGGMRCRAKRRKTPAREGVAARQKVVEEVSRVEKAHVLPVSDPGTPEARAWGDDGARCVHLCESSRGQTREGSF